MKTLLIASALTLIANTALANDIYGAFVNPDVDSTHGNNYGVTFPVGQSHDFRPSIEDFHLGNPGYPQVFAASAPSVYWAAETRSRDDYLLRDNPDSGHGPRSGSDPRAVRPGTGAFALDRLTGGDRI